MFLVSASGNTGMCPSEAGEISQHRPGWVKGDHPGPAEDNTKQSQHQPLGPTGRGLLSSVPEGRGGEELAVDIRTLQISFRTSVRKPITVLNSHQWPSHSCYLWWWWWFSCSVVSNSCDPMDCGPPGSSVYGILQARILEWTAISFSILMMCKFKDLLDIVVLEHLGWKISSLHLREVNHNRKILVSLVLVNTMCQWVIYVKFYISGITYKYLLEIFLAYHDVF